jgi:hypothetical protein
MDSTIQDQNYPVNVDLSVGTIISNGISIGLKNLGPLIGTTILWVITIWIPYLNIGTTIAMSAIVLSMSRNETLSPTEIFKPHYRKYMGEYFILIGLMMIGVYAGLIMFIIPGIVISISWSLAILLLIDKGLSPIDSLMTSNKLTYGYKWTIFLAEFIFVIAYMIVYLILGWILSDSPIILGLFVIVLTILFMPFAWGLNAYIYRELQKTL